MEIEPYLEEFFFDRRYAATPMTSPDFVKLADAHGIPATRVTTPEEIASAVEFARQTTGPVVVEFVVEKEESVYPMVATGADLDDMIRRPTRRSTQAAD